MLPASNISLNRESASVLDCVEFISKQGTIRLKSFSKVSIVRLFVKDMTNATKLMIKVV